MVFTEHVKFIVNMFGCNLSSLLNLSCEIKGFILQISQPTINNKWFTRKLRKQTKKVLAFKFTIHLIDWFEYVITVGFKLKTFFGTQWFNINILSDDNLSKTIYIFSRLIWNINSWYCIYSRISTHIPSVVLLRKYITL